MEPRDDTRARRKARLRRAARRALGRYDLDVRRVRLLLDEFNCIYRVEAADEAQYVLRLTSKRGVHEVAETNAEIAWLDALRRTTDLRVPRPVPMADGSFVGVVDQDLAPCHGQHVLFEWMPGSVVGERFGRATAVRLGRLMAELHRHAATFSLPDGCRARPFDSAFPYDNTAFSLREPVRIFDDEFAALYTPALLGAYERAIGAAQDATDELFAGRESPRLIHADLHPWNVLMTEGRLAAIDFEDLMWGFPIQDVATTLYYLRVREKDGAVMEAAYREGYEARAPWPARDERQLAAFLAGRGLILVNTVLTAPDPEERARAAHWIRVIGERMARWID